MHQPPGFCDSNLPTNVCKLRKSVYRVKQAPKAWFAKLFQALQSFGFTQSSSDASLFVLKASVPVIVLVYVDNILVLGPNPFLCQHFIEKLTVVFLVKDLGPLHYFLGLEVQGSSEGIFLHQSKYLLNLLQKINIEGAKPCSTPLSTQKLDNKCPLLTNVTEYRSIVEALQYLT